MKTYYRIAYQGRGAGWTHGPVRASIEAARRDRKTIESEPEIGGMRIMACEAQSRAAARQILHVSSRGFRMES